MKVTTMKNSNVLKAILILSGLIAAVFGGSILFAPVAFSAHNGIDMAGQVNLLNETRSAGAALMVIGLLILSGAFMRQLMFTATLVAMLMYLAYGMARLLSMALDGMPVSGLIVAAMVEPRYKTMLTLPPILPVSQRIGTFA